MDSYTTLTLDHKHGSDAAPLKATDFGQGQGKRIVENNFKLLSDLRGFEYTILGEEPAMQVSSSEVVIRVKGHTKRGVDNQLADQFRRTVSKLGNYWFDDESPWHSTQEVPADAHGPVAPSSKANVKSEAEPPSPTRSQPQASPNGYPVLLAHLHASSAGVGPVYSTVPQPARNEASTAQLHVDPATDPEPVPVYAIDTPGGAGPSRKSQVSAEPPAEILVDYAPDGIMGLLSGLLGVVVNGVTFGYYGRWTRGASNAAASPIASHTSHPFTQSSPDSYFCTMTREESYCMRTIRATKISGKVTFHHPDGIRLGWCNVIHPYALLSGDPVNDGVNGPTIVSGDYCIFGKRTLIRPARSLINGVGTYERMNIGHHVWVGARSTIHARSIGNYVEIGEDCFVPQGVTIGDGARLTPGTVLKPNTHVPAWSFRARSQQSLITAESVRRAIAADLREMTIAYYDSIATVEHLHA